MRVIWAPRAIERASEIAAYIAQDRPAAAGRWVHEIFAATATLRRFPRRGRKVPEVNRPDIRELLHGPYRIIYRLEARRVAVLTIRHARRLFDPEELKQED